MKNALFILAGAAALSLSSCSQEKTTEVTTTPADGMATTTTTTTTYTPMTDAQVEERAQRIADKMVADMKISDEGMKTKIRTVYVNRYKRMNDMGTKYATDTMGMAADRRSAMMAEDEEFKTVFTDPTQYQAYQSNRSTYDDSNYSGDNMSAAPMAADDNTMASGEGNMNNMETGKTKMEDGSKMKVKSDGDVKIKDAEGNKLKVAGDDGTIKVKPVDGENTKIK